jgi:hypothetical protein
VFAYSNRDWENKSLVLYNNSYYAASGWIRRSSPAIPQEDGSFRQDTLSEALSIHGEGRYFTLFREQRSGLWYIRSSKDLSERGLFVSLNGYEAQVFLDIHEVTDLNGRWARLNHELSGRGVPDLQAAIREIFLGELYRPFAAVFAEKLMDKEGLKEAVLAFITAAGEYVGGAGGRYDPFTTGWDHPPVEPERILGEFAAFLERWDLISGGAGTVPQGTGKNTARFLKKIREKLALKPYIAAFAAAYGVLALLRRIIGEGASGADAAALLSHWQLDRKLWDCFNVPEIPDDEAGRVIAIMRLVLSRTGPEDLSPYQSPPLGEALVLVNYEAEDFRTLLGVNFFEDAVWFNKEAFADTLFYAALFTALEGDAAFEAVKRPQPAAGGKTGPAFKRREPKAAPAGDDARWLKRLDTIAELTEQFERAEKDSGYKLERLMEGLSEPGGAPEAAVGSSPGKKAAPPKSAKKPGGAKK